MKISVQIPTSLREITLRQYQQYEASKKTPEDTIRIFLKGSQKQIRNLPANVINSLTDDIKKVFESENVFYNKVKIGGQMYGFIPSLNEMSYGEYIDVIENIGSWETIHKSMAVLYRPIELSKGKDYTIAKYNGTANLSETMESMPLDVALGAVFFLINLQMTLLNDTLNSTLDNLTEKQEMDLLKSGVNTTQLYNSLTLLGWDSTKLQISV